MRIKKFINKTGEIYIEVETIKRIINNFDFKDFNCIVNPIILKDKTIRNLKKDLIKRFEEL